MWTNPRRSSTQHEAASRFNFERSPTANTPSMMIGASSIPVATKVVTQRERNTMKDVVIDPDYWMAISVAALCPLILWYHPCTFVSLITTKSLVLGRVCVVGAVTVC
jgi:hypothetical protein